MTHYIERSYSRDQLNTWCEYLSALARVRLEEKQPVQLMNSDVAWQLSGSDPKENVVFWYDQEELVAYAWFQPPCNLIFDVLDDHETNLVPTIIEWASSRRQKFDKQTMPFLEVEDMDGWRRVLDDIAKHAQHDSRVLLVSAFEFQRNRISKLDDLGFEATSHHEPHMMRVLSVGVDNLKASGTVGDAEPDNTKNKGDDRGLLEIVSTPKDQLDAYSAAHRAAWSPGSSFSAETVDRISQIGNIFDPELMLAAKVDNEFAATGIFWQDPNSKIGNIEPFGVAPPFRGRRYGGQRVSNALIEGGMLRLQARGMDACRVYTAGFNHQAQRLYRSCGFTDIGVARTFSIELD